jgi:hypothetical protein
MNNMESYKVGAINAIAMLLSFTGLEDVLKITLLLVSIIYTVLKIIEIIKKNKDKKNETN